MTANINDQRTPINNIKTPHDSRGSLGQKPVEKIEVKKPGSSVKISLILLITFCVIFLLGGILWGMGSYHAIPMMLNAGKSIVYLGAGGVGIYFSMALCLGATWAIGKISGCIL